MHSSLCLCPAPHVEGLGVGDPGDCPLCSFQPECFLWIYLYQVNRSCLFSYICITRGCFCPLLINTFRSDDLLYVAPTALKIDQIYNNVSIALNIIEGDNQLLEEINLLAVFVALVVLSALSYKTFSKIKEDGARWDCKFNVNASNLCWIWKIKTGKEN